MAGPFTCAACGEAFTLPDAVLARYPGWAPRACRACRDAAKGATPARGTSVTAQRTLSPEEVLARFTEGPKDGVFTDGGANPNPGPGAWAYAIVEGDAIVEARAGRDGDTTNNRMELTALVEAYRRLPEDASTVVHSDSELCVKTVTLWARGWEKAGWRRKTGPIKNLDLVKELFALARARPRVTLRWVPAHSGWRWNEYVDALVARELGLG